MAWSSLTIFGLLTIFYVQMDTSSELSQEIVRWQVFNTWARYAAEASIERQQAALKSEDIDSVDIFNEAFIQWTSADDKYWVVNKWVSSSYFDLALDTSTTAEIELWSIVWWDILLEDIQTQDRFWSFVLNYNTSVSSSDLLVEIVKKPKGDSFTKRCNFNDIADVDCDNSEKSVIFTRDNTLDGGMLDSFYVEYLPWDDWYGDKLKVSGFIPDSYDYRVVFSTEMGNAIPFSYYVLDGSTKKKVANNHIEIDTIWNAWDNFSRIRMEKKIVNSLKPLPKYVLFSDSSVEK